MTASQWGGLALLMALLAAAMQSADAAACYRSVTQAEYPFCLQLEPNIVLHWKTAGDDITFAMDADGLLGWVALGISEAGNRGVDYDITIRSAQAQTWVHTDYFAIDGMNPILDIEQNGELLVAPTQDKQNKTFMVFTRELDTCDLEDVAIYYNVQRTLVWAYGNKWDQDKLNFTNFIRGFVPGVNLYANANATAAAQPDASSSTNVTLAMQNVTVPRANSSVLCTNLQLPNDGPYHAVRYAGALSANSSRLVHHMMGYVCADGVVPPQAAGTAYDCSFAVPVGCERLYMVWAPGSAPFVAPAEAGFPINSGGAGSYMVLQVHYQNPNATVAVDSSGFLVTVTTSLRNNSLGVLTLGNTDLRIPAAQDRYQALPNICPASCTGRRVTGGNVTLVSNFFLMNQLGTTIMTRHIRNGSAIQPLGSRNFWDPNFTGHMGVLPDSKVLMPNDTLITICSYNTANKTRGLTTYGLSPGDELCFNYVTFYPSEAMPSLDYCIANTRKNISTCATRSALAAMVVANATDNMQLANGTMVAVGPLNITYYRSTKCKLHDTAILTPTRKPNTKGALASIIIVTVVLVLVGVILWTRYARQEELEELLMEISAAEKAELTGGIQRSAAV